MGQNIKLWNKTTAISKQTHENSTNTQKNSTNKREKNGKCKIRTK